MKKNRRNFTKILISLLLVTCFPIIKLKAKYQNLVKKNYKDKIWILSSKD